MQTEAPKQAKQSLEDTIRFAAAHVEADVHKVIKYINDEVVPDVRRSGSVALRTAATELQRLAERMDDSKRGTPPAPYPKV